MSDALFTQAQHTLELIESLDKDELNVLHKYLPSLVRGVRVGILPPIEKMEELLGYSFSIDVDHRRSLYGIAMDINQNRFSSSMVTFLEKYRNVAGGVQNVTKERLKLIRPRQKGLRGLTSYLEKKLCSSY
jgi:hypothetical protein